ncbi:MAG TPA: PAS domain S-box protein [Proteobacteria bacterium]|nr:PAS domain S-box protein [Pseudomonadota bacterium]
MVFYINECRQVERSGRSGLAFERTVSDISSRFVGIYDLDDAVNASLADIGKLSGVNRTYLFLLSEDGTAMNNTHEWCAEGVRPEIQNLKNLPTTMFPWIMSRLSEDKVLRIEDISRLPAEAQAEVSILEGPGGKSALVLPLQTRKRLTGFLGLANASEVDKWRDEDVALLCIASDILGSAFDRRQMEEELRKSEEKYRAIFENTGTAMLVVEEDTTICLANTEFEKLSGYSKEEIGGKKSWTELFHKDDLERMKTYHRLRRIDPNAAPRSYDCRFVDRYGNTKDIFITVSMVPGTKKSLGSLMEITERKQMERALWKTKQWFERTLKSLADAVFILDADTFRIVECNPAASAIFGYSHDEMLGQETTFLHVSEKDRETFRLHLWSTIEEKGYANHFGFKMKRKDGTIFPAEHSMTPIEDEGGRRIAWVSVVSDISERKQAEKEKEMMQAQLLQAQKMEAIGTLAGGVAHDFNNALTGIQGYTELAMTKTDEADPLYRYLIQIQRSSMRAASLARQLLLFSRKQPMEFVPLNISRVVEGLLKMLHRLIGEDIEIVTDLAPDLWTVRADVGNIEQVIMNLVVNARDAMPHGGKLTIQTKNVIVDKECCTGMTCAMPWPEVRLGQYACLSVADTGTGIDKAVLERIFDPFFTTKRPGEGTGLGLSTTYGIVGQHGGCIAVHSEPGQGSIFYIYLPAVPLEPIGEETEHTISLSNMQGKGERILLVEDEKEVRELGVTILSRNGYIVFEAANAREALDIFERENGNFHMVLSDVVLPDQDALGLVDRLLARKPGLPVLLSSGYMDDKSQWPLIRQRGFHFIQKPYAVASLLQAVKKVLVPSSQF